MAGRAAWLALALLTLASCSLVPGGRPEPPPSPRGDNARIVGVHPGPSFGSLDVARADADAALASFRESCPRLLSRNDASGLTVRSDWEMACGVAREWRGGDARDFFANYFETVRVGSGVALATGYYEPEIAGVRTRRPGYDVPIYRMPPDLVRAKPGDAAPLSSGQMPLGRYDRNGRFVAYHDRTAIEQGALMGRGLELGWAADPVEFFFLQVQGSGRLRAPDGSVVRIGYAGQNGLPYTGIGGVMRDRGLVGSGKGKYSGSMQGIMQYIRDNPRDGAALMRENRSFVFFREVSGDGPVGALGVPVRRESSVAADPAFVPLGAPVWLKVDRAEASGMWVAQDTGGAIKGANRFDTFWGSGAEARQIAGGMSGRGKALVLLPKGTLQQIRRR